MFECIFRERNGSWLVATDAAIFRGVNIKDGGVEDGIFRSGKAQRKSGVFCHCEVALLTSSQRQRKWDSAWIYMDWKKAHTNRFSYLRLA